MGAVNDPAVLLLGGTGQIGHELGPHLSRLGTVVAPDREEVDFTAPNSLRHSVQRLEPDVVVNAAAYTAVDEAEDEPERAALVNGKAPEVLAEAAQAVGAWLVHYSTDYVFDGLKTTPYVESDPANPVNVYGRTKRTGEEAVQEVGGRFLILRTGWVYSARRSNFLRTMLRLADERERITVVDDQIGTPTWAGWVAEATATIVRRLLNAKTPDAHRGLYHLVGSGQTSRYGFARAIFSHFDKSEVTVEPVSTDEYPTRAARPPYTVLDPSRVRETFDLSIPTWSQQLAQFRRRTTDAEPAGVDEECSGAKI